MEFKYDRVNLDQVDSEDTRYKISSGDVKPELVASIDRLGLLNLPILTTGNDRGFKIVSGFKRIAACRQLGVAHIPARFLSSEQDMGQAIQIAIEDNTSQRELNLIEQARAIELLWMYHLDMNKLVDAANMAGLAVNMEMAAKLKILAGMNALVQKGVLEGSLSLPVAMQLHGLKDAEGANVIAELLVELGLSLNRQREVIENIVSICRRDDLLVQQLLMEDAIRDCRNNGEIDRKQKGAQIRGLLKRRRYPNIARHEQRFAVMVRKLNLSPGTHLIPPQFFESPTYTLKIDFKSPKELAEKLGEIDRLSKSQELKTLWE